ncbi:DUF2267 domain-containing protein [Streptomyces sp. Ru73]|uniref:DUF2267 domain-containing protein n=1 Tax=Streptomyces sp. Ru73 TaxID=2080748 RepID=UPI000CDD880C|nr:DUF2267 domain-containing protein [Streptomyces sp. Ru73]POX39342.1 DUF2267 domain-containing protein [Streptomyces sp. Ru73]
MGGDLLGAVRTSGRYRTTAEAERALRQVLAAFAGQLSGAERAALLGALPPEAARLVAGAVRDERRRTACAFVDGVAARTEGATHATARWDASTVLMAVGAHLGEELLQRILDRLPRGYALLFGRADLRPTAGPVPPAPS